MTELERATLGRLAIDIDSGTLLHAYLVVGMDKEALTKFGLLAIRYSLCRELCGRCAECLKIQSGNHTSVELCIKEKFNVEDVAEIIYKCNLKTIEGGDKFFIINDAAALNVAAQNKLLKTLEEPPESTHFFLCTSRPDMLLPTIRSRTAKIILPPVSESRLREMFDDGEDADIAVRYSAGSVSLAAEILKDYDKLAAVRLADSLPDRMKFSKDILAMTAEIVANKDNISLFLDALEIKYGSLINNKTEAATLGYSYTALAYIIEAIIEGKKRIVSNCGLVAVVDTLLFKILEVRQKYAHSS